MIIFLKNSVFVCYCFAFLPFVFVILLRFGGKEKLALVPAAIHMPHTFNRPFISFVYFCISSVRVVYF